MTVNQIHVYAAAMRLAALLSGPTEQAASTEGMDDGQCGRPK